MPQKCSVGGCHSNYSTTKRYFIYKFPTDPDECEKWLSVSRNVIDKDAITKNMGVCRRHWPENITMKKLFGREVSDCPPSLFVDCPPSFSRQTTNIMDRNVENRKITSFNCFVVRCDDLMRLIFFDTSYDSIECSMMISSDFSIEARKRNTKVRASALQDILGFQYKLRTWSQLEAIIARVKNYSLNESQEIEAAVRKILSGYRAFEI